MRRGIGLSPGQIFVLLTLPLLAFLGFSAGKKALEAYSLWQQAEELRGEIQQLKERNAELREQIEYLRSDAYVEKVAREDLNLVKPGDVAIVAVYPTPAATPPPPTPTPTPVRRSLVEEWLGRLATFGSLR